MKTALSSICVSLLLAVPSYAENVKLGRTADGRAYRVDSEGNKVVDYIADLESNVDGLERQVQGLEDELQEKIQVIQRLQAGQGCESSIKERDLGDNKARYADSDFVQSGSFQQDCSQAVANAQAQLKGQSERSDALRRNEILALQDKLANAQNESRVLQARLGEQVSTKMLAESSSALAMQKQELQKELDLSKRTAASLDQEIRSTSDSIAQLKDELSMKQEEYNLLQAQVAASEKRTAVLKEQQKTQEDLVKQQESEPVKAAPKPERASLSPRALAVNENSYGVSEGLSESRQRALDTIKGRINTEFNQVQSTIAARDRMLKEYRAQQKSAVAFNPSAARSADGEDIEMLRLHLEKVRSMRDVSHIQAALKEIQRRMDDDIALMRRLKRIQ